MNKLFLLLIALLGFLLTSINTYGLFQDLRPPHLETNLQTENADFRFQDEVLISSDIAMSLLKKLPNETKYDFAIRANSVVQQGLAHIQWHTITDNQKYNQLVPIWENYFLYFMGLFSGIPEYEKYHFADYKRSLERGIGICGDASMVLSQVLTKNGILNEIISFPGHVVLSVTFDEFDNLVLDPDFGVVIPHDVSDFKNKPNQIGQYYLDAGYTAGDSHFIQQMASESFARWQGVSHFITNKYYFEYISYSLKWPFPMGLLFISWALYRRNKLKMQDKAK